MITSILGTEFEFCRGIYKGCRRAIKTYPEIISELVEITKDSSWHQRFKKLEIKPKQHQNLKIGISACPNGCAKPQIKDLGFILKSKIGFNEALCVRCFKCEKTCKENAIFIKENFELQKDRCLGCLDCVRECATGSLYSTEIFFEVLLGGRLGRHPKFGTPILKIEPSNIYDFYKYFLRLFDKYPNIYIAKKIIDNISKDQIRYGYIKK